MTDSTEEDPATYRGLASIAVPRRTELVATMLGLVPFGTGETFRAVDIGCGEGHMAAALLDCFPHATLLALDGSEAMRAETVRRTERCRSRIDVRPFDLATLDWWDLVRGAGVVLSSLCLHHLNAAKKQYLFKAIAERLSPGGAFLIADIVEPQHPAVRHLWAESWDASVEHQAAQTGSRNHVDAFHSGRRNHFRFPDAADVPSPLFFQLVWLKHAGFIAADCFWAAAGHAVYGGFKAPEGGPAVRLPYSTALEAVRRAFGAPPWEAP